MRRWVTCFSVLLIAASPAFAQERLTQDEALRAAFPAPQSIERRTAYLGSAQLDSARSLAGPEVPLDQSVVTFYAGRLDGALTGVAYFDSHTVRSKTEVVMVVVGRDNRVKRVEILRFDEPPEYRASQRWLDQLAGKALDPALSLKGDVVNLTGASLTSRALVRATRRALALHTVIHPYTPAP